MLFIEHSSLFCQCINSGEKKFYNFDYKFLSVISLPQKFKAFWLCCYFFGVSKLECLTLVNISTLV
jgi:hypothetical protein